MGTFVNAEGIWQSFSGVVAPLGDARPAWKVFRVLGNLFDCDGFDHLTSEDVLNEVKNKSGSVIANNNIEWHCPDQLDSGNSADLVRISELQMYMGDSLQRRAHALQSTYDADPAAIRINAKLAERIGVSDGSTAIAARLPCR